jgi:PIN domain nuclease of toxin-antitoxin system
VPYLLDTCAILFIAENTADLSAATLKLIDAAPAGEVFVSAISVAQLACHQERRKITLQQHWRSWWDAVLERTAWTCLPVTAGIMAEASVCRRRSTATRRIAFSSPPPGMNAWRS